ncbi:sensor histidine kinase KdpD [Mesonia sp. K7]|uniref:sensor histidine kinase n=1 Tax=Mesonia sp. K7 TaxID=2218606 RepID=UPI000DA74E44|nr:HAMP domain-containing sensor histidine kinase [Mesonia sp. K7]PZD79214.1 sensor histidine kinase [Mesonia sp. K7]
MKLKSLKILAILSLIALSLIQSYLVYNTYQLKKRTLIIDANRTVARIYNTPTIDSIMWLYRNDFLEKLRLYKEEKIDKKILLNELKKKTSEINPLFTEAYQNAFLPEEKELDIDFKKSVSLIQLVDSNNDVEDLITPNELPIFLLGDNFKEENGILINNSTWNKEHTYTKDSQEMYFQLVFKTQIHMNLVNIETSIFRKMLFIFILSFLLFLFVTALFYLSIKNLNQQKRLSEVKSDFINNITHELKTPLSTLAIATKTLTSTYTKQNAHLADEVIQVINRQNVRLQRLIDQVIDNSLGYQEIQLHQEPINLHQLLTDILKDYQIHLAPEIKLIYQLKSKTTAPSYYGDKFFLNTAIVNLLNNAVKYEGKTINITYQVKKDMHLISIEDDGIGIAKAHQPHIFNKFYRVSEKNVHNYKGLGLGLYYTSQIIKAHQGTIEVQSRLTKGTSFLIKLPTL